MAIFYQKNNEFNKSKEFFEKAIKIEEIIYRSNIEKNPDLA